MGLINLDAIEKAGKMLQERIDVVPAAQVARIASNLELILSNLASITYGLRLLVDKAVKFFDKENQ